MVAKQFLKRGRKIFATISYNKNPDYKWVLYVKSGFALSGYNTKEEAIERANKMITEYNSMLKTL